MLAVPAGYMSLCDALRQLEENTWRELEAGYNAHQRLDEESVTSYHLMRLATAVPAVILEKHYRGREARTGADWEWWVGRPGAYVGFRVQAKIIDAAGMSYRNLFTSRTNALKQVDKLIDNATNASRPLYPLYAFYNFWLPGAHPVLRWPCPRHATEPRCAGWMIASAESIRDVLLTAPSKKLAPLSRLMYPVSCAFCCPRSCRSQRSDGSETLAESVTDWFRAQWENYRPPSIYEVGPVYVERLYKGETATHGSSWLSSFIPRPERKLPKGISRVVLLRDQFGKLPPHLG